VCVLVSDDPRVGTELAGYRIESLLGWGGMSVAYLAEDLRLKRRVALKMLVAGLAGNESFCERFLDESELAASIDHQNIVPIYEAGAIEDLLFIAMRNDARVWSGIHFRTADTQGAVLGKKGRPVPTQALLPAGEPGGTPRGPRSCGPLR
jgi:hypothetical protein